MKMVVLDGYTLNPGDLDWQVLAPFGALSVYPSSMKEDVCGRIGDAEVVFVNKTQITEEVLAACPGVRFWSSPTAPAPTTNASCAASGPASPIPTAASGRWK